MRHLSTWRAIALAGLLVVFFTGCPQTGGPEPAGKQPGQQEQQPPGQGTSAEATPVKPPPPTVPEVHLTEALRATCLVFAGDQMPTGELPDLQGNPRSLAELSGKKLTVILFWTRGDSLFSQMAATSALEDLQKDVVEPYADKGVGVVAINVGDSPQSAAENIQEAKAAFPELSDPEGKFFGRVATQALPRVYLVDAEGKIVWFDLDFSRTTRRNLLQAIQVKLGEV